MVQEPAANFVELIEGAVGDLEGAALLLALEADAHVKAEGTRQIALKGQRVGVLGGCAGGGASLLGRLGFGFADVQAAGNNALGRRDRIGIVQQRPAVAGGQQPGVQHLAHFHRQIHQPQRVGDVAAAASDQLGNLFLGMREFVDQALIALGLFDRGQVLALDVFYQRDFERFLVVEVLDYNRNLGQPGLLRGAPTPFAGDDLVAVGRIAVAPDQNLLQDAVLAHLGHQLPQVLLVKPVTRL